MNRFAPLILALVLAGAGSTALAEDAKNQLSKQTPKVPPVQMTEAQLDNVAGGALINAVLVDVVDVRNVQVAIPVNASVAIAILGAAGSAALQRPGRQIQ